jgi:ribosomal protein S18 acetylase RimI-like enzyme
MNTAPRALIRKAELMASSMEIRPATPADVPAVIPMVQSLAALHRQWDPDKYGYKANVGEMYRSWLASRAIDPRSVFLVADHGGTVVGFIVSTIEREIPIYELGEYAFIHDLWIEPDYRNEGIGRQLVMVTVERFTGMNIRQIRLDTAAANDVARSLFSVCGFRPSTVEMVMKTGSGR